MTGVVVEVRVAVVDRRDSREIVVRMVVRAEIGVVVVVVLAKVRRSSLGVAVVVVVERGCSGGRGGVTVEVQKL